MNNKKVVFTVFLSLLFFGLKAQKEDSTYHEPYRPQEHFSPAAHWMNDPNGMVYENGVYHLFFQYYPNGTTWGPMHWGHAVSKDMIHWQQLPVALYPDSLGYIFSGSAVLDQHNTSGFSKNGKAPLVAIFTSHDPKGEKTGSDKFQNESIAYSLDSGTTWIKYLANPVLKNPGIRDFRDPKVMWYGPQKKWLMTLATKDRVTFFSSPDLKTWNKESDFGKSEGAHGGVWECPDLFPLNFKGKTYWVLLVSVNPGGPNGGSGTQYFVGDFDGTTFTPLSIATKWVDYGPDDYAGVTWSNTGSRKIFLGWMSNWIYAAKVPTEKWRSAMTIPRDLDLTRIGPELVLTSHPVKELNAVKLPRIDLSKELSTGRKINTGLPNQFSLKLELNNLKSYSIILSNDHDEQLVIGYDKISNRYYIDRTKAGKSDFDPQFAKIFFAPRLSISQSSNLELIVDKASAELFADDGLSVMTCIFFPNQPFDHLQFKNLGSTVVKNTVLLPLKSIW